jgi:hypothetical protein
MGSFSYGCAVSGLPIHAGDPVRFFLLTENPYDGEESCYMHGHWFPRTFPIKARYNDYGSVEDYEEGPETRAWLDGLKLDLIERGWGDNSVHDVAVRKEMKFEELLEALWERRILVKPSSNHIFNHSLDLLLGRMTPEEVKEEEARRAEFDKTWKKRQGGVPKGVPTRKRVESMLVKADLPLYGGPDGNGLAVDEIGYGEIRVRWEGFGKDYGKDKEKLDLAKKALKGRYASVVSASQKINDSGDLRIFPKIGTANYHGSNREKKKRPLKVGAAMIREDVWQALLTGVAGDDDLTIEQYRELGREVEKKLTKDGLIGVPRSTKKSKTAEAKNASRRLSWMIMQDDWKNPVSRLVSKDLIPFQVGLHTHFQLLAGRGGKLPEGFFDMASEFAFIHFKLMMVRHMWRVSTSAGPQFGDWKSHIDFHASMAKIARECRKKDRE